MATEDIGGNAAGAAPAERTVAACYPNVDCPDQQAPGKGTGTEAPAAIVVGEEPPQLQLDHRAPAPTPARADVPVAVATEGVGGNAADAATAEPTAAAGYPNIDLAYFWNPVALSAQLGYYVVLIASLGLQIHNFRKYGGWYTYAVKMGDLTNVVGFLVNNALPVPGCVFCGWAIFVIHGRVPSTLFTIVTVPWAWAIFLACAYFLNTFAVAVPIISFSFGFVAMWRGRGRLAVSFVFAGTLVQTPPSITFRILPYLTKAAPLWVAAFVYPMLSLIYTVLMLVAVGSIWWLLRDDAPSLIRSSVLAMIRSTGDALALLGLFLGVAQRPGVWSVLQALLSISFSGVFKMISRLIPKVGLAWYEWWAKGMRTPYDPVQDFEVRFAFIQTYLPSNVLLPIVMLWAWAAFSDGVPRQPYIWIVFAAYIAGDVLVDLLVLLLQRRRHGQQAKRGGEPPPANLWAPLQLLQEPGAQLAPEGRTGRTADAVCPDIGANPDTIPDTFGLRGTTWCTGLVVTCGPLAVFSNWRAPGSSSNPRPAICPIDGRVGERTRAETFFGVD